MPFSECSTTCTPSGTWLGTRVGMPMPRLTYWPSVSSAATRAASWSRVSGISGAFLSGLVAGRGGDGGAGAGAGGELLDLLVVGGGAHHPVDEDAGQVHLLGGDLPGLDQGLDLGDGDPGGHAGQRVEVGRGLVEDQVAVPVPERG